MPKGLKNGLKEFIRTYRLQCIYGTLLVLCIVSRLFSTVYYIEDTDSLRFALAVLDFDVGALRPHFPGYPVFVFCASALYSITGSFASSFALIGGVSVFVLIVYTGKLAGYRPDTKEGLVLAALVFFAPLIWLLSNRYMPDLLGCALALAALTYLLDAERSRRSALLGMFLCALLAGVRLSTMPLLLLPVLWVMFKRRGDILHLLLAGVAGLLIWLLPFVWISGWDTLVTAAGGQAHGHFAKFGGTVFTDADYGRRLLFLLQSLVADGLGGYWIGRHEQTLAVSIGLVIITAAAWMFPRKGRLSERTKLVLGACLLYLLWIFFFQNVIHKSRHVLPLLPFVLIGLSLACARIIRRGAMVGQVFVLAFIASVAAVGISLAVQHTRPSAIAGLLEYLRSSQNSARHIVCVPLIEFYLSTQGVQARFTVVEPREGLPPHLDIPPDAPLVMVGRFHELLPGRQFSHRSFYHNPYVNRMWPEIELYESLPNTEGLNR